LLGFVAFLESAFKRENSMNSKNAITDKGCKEQRTQAMQPFGFAQGHEWFDVTHHPEHVEGPVEWQMMS